MIYANLLLEKKSGSPQKVIFITTKKYKWGNKDMMVYHTISDISTFTLKVIKSVLRFLAYISTKHGAVLNSNGI